MLDALFIEGFHQIRNFTVSNLFLPTIDKVVTSVLELDVAVLVPVGLNRLLLELVDIEVY